MWGKSMNEAGIRGQRTENRELGSGVGEPGTGNWGNVYSRAFSRRRFFVVMPVSVFEREGCYLSSKRSHGSMNREWWCD